MNKWSSPVLLGNKWYRVKGRKIGHDDSKYRLCYIKNLHIFLKHTRRHWRFYNKKHKGWGFIICLWKAIFSNPYQDQIVANKFFAGDIDRYLKYKPCYWNKWGLCRGRSSAGRCSKKHSKLVWPLLK